MATRRIVSTSKEPTVLDKDDNLPPAKGIAGKGNTTPAVSTDTIVKLLVFTAAMIVLPIGTYYGTMATIFKPRELCASPWSAYMSGNATLAGASAAAVANIVLIAYILVAIQDDKSEEEEKKTELKKTK